MQVLAVGELHTHLAQGVSTHAQTAVSPDEFGVFYHELDSRHAPSPYPTQLEYSPGAQVASTATPARARTLPIHLRPLAFDHTLPYGVPSASRTQLDTFIPRPVGLSPLSPSSTFLVPRADELDNIAPSVFLGRSVAFPSVHLPNHAPHSSSTLRLSLAMPYRPFSAGSTRSSTLRRFLGHGRKAAPPVPAPLKVHFQESEARTPDSVSVQCGEEVSPEERRAHAAELMTRASGCSCEG